MQKNLIALLLIFVSFNMSVACLTVKDITAKIDQLDSGRGLDTTSYIYSDWNQNITIGMDGSLLIVEEMTFRLDAGSYSYAYRDLKWRNFHDVNSWSIKSGENTPSINSHNMEREAGEIHFKWEWTRRTVTSNTEYTFILTYNVSSAMDLRGNRDRVYWNIIGGEFVVPIYDVDTIVIFPDEYSVEDVRSTTYYDGQSQGDDTGTVANVNNQTTVTFHQSVVEAYSSYTIDTDSPPAGINMPFSWRVYLTNNWILVIVFCFTPIFLFFIITFLIKGIDPKAKAIPTLNEVAIKKCFQCGFKDFRKIRFCPQCGEEMKSVSEVGPPNDLTPAEVGTLLDEKFDKIDFIAEIFYLAEKGYLKLIQTTDDNEIFFQRTENNEYYGSLSKFNRGILKFIEKNSYETIWFKDASEKSKEIPVEVTSLSTIKTNIHSLWNHKSDVYNRLAGGDTKYFETNPEKTRSTYFGLSIFTGIGGAAVLYFASKIFYIDNLLTGLIGVILASFIGLLISRKMPKLTKHGAEMKASWNSYLQLIRGQMLGFPDPYDQFNYSMDHFSYLLVTPNFDLPSHLKHISRRVSKQPPRDNFHYITPYWFYYPHIYIPRVGGPRHRTITGFDSMGRGFESVVNGISNIAESLPKAISNMAEGLTTAISNMSEGFTPPSSSGGSSGFGGGFSGGGGGGGGGGIG